jgi:hypothetical protein
MRKSNATKWMSATILLLMMMTPLVYASSSDSSSSAACSSATLDRQMLNTSIPISQTTAKNYAQSSSLYSSIVEDNSSAFTGTGNQWDLNFGKCSVSLSGVLVNYLLNSTSGPAFILTFEVNPTTGIVSNYGVHNWFSASIATNASETYSGYGVAVATHPSGESDEVNYTGTYWLAPTVSNDASPGCGSSGSSQCSMAIWTGLQNSTYDGPDHVVAPGEVIQTGTIFTDSCSASCSSSYYPFSEFTSGTTSGIYESSISSCTWNVTPGDDMVASVGSQAVVNGTSGKAFYTFLEDDTTAKACDYPYNTSGSPKCNLGGNQVTCKIEGHEYYADYFLERTQCGSSCFYQLPDFTNFDFYRGEMLNSSTGNYPYYNDGYGIGSSMSNSGTVNTITGTMSETGGSIHYGYFEESYSSSVNT